MAPGEGTADRAEGGLDITRISYLSYLCLWMDKRDKRGNTHETLKSSPLLCMITIAEKQESMQNLAFSAADANRNSGSVTQTDTEGDGQVNQAAASGRASLASLGHAGHSPASIRALDPAIPYNPAVASLVSISQVHGAEQLRMDHLEVAVQHHSVSPYGPSLMPFGGMVAHPPPHTLLPRTYHGIGMYAAPMAAYHGIGMYGAPMAYQQSYAPFPPAYHGIGMYGSYPMPPVAAPSNAEGNFKSESPTAAAGNPLTALRTASYPASGRKSVGIKGVWGKRYSELDEFKEVNGHCNVPQRYAANVELGRWVKVSKSRMIRHQMLIKLSQTLIL